MRTRLQTEAATFMGAHPSHRKRIAGLIAALLALLPLDLGAAEPQALDLAQTIDLAIQVNTGVQAAKEGVQAAKQNLNAQRAAFLPVLGASYAYEENDEEIRTAGRVITQPKEVHTLLGKATQPLFTGFALLNNYRIAGLNLTVAEVQEKVSRQDVILAAKQGYFNLLKTQKLAEVADQTVVQIEAQKEVARNFYEVGMTARNDLLQAEVELANARQQAVVARNNHDAALATLNTVLRRPLDSPLSLADVTAFESFAAGLDACQKEAEANRLELKLQDLEVALAEKQVALSRKDYYPSVNLVGSTYKIGTDWDVDGGAGISNPNAWDVTATASWNFWEWGKTRSTVAQKRHQLEQARFRRVNTLDQLLLDVKKAYLKIKEAETNITTAAKAIEQAEENYRINQERYREQVATATDVLTAQTLLTRSKTNYFSALYDFYLSRAALERAMGRETFQ